MSSGLIDMELNTRSGTFHGEIEDHALLDAGLIIAGMHNEEWRGGRRGFECVVDPFLISFPEKTGITHDAEVRPAVDVVDFVDRPIATLVEVGRCLSHQVAAS